MVPGGAGVGIEEESNGTAMIDHWRPEIDPPTRRRVTTDADEG